MKSMISVSDIPWWMTAYTAGQITSASQESKEFLFSEINSFFIIDYEYKREMRFLNFRCIFYGNLYLSFFLIIMHIEAEMFFYIYL